MTGAWAVDLEGQEYWTHFIAAGEPLCGRVSLHGNNTWIKEPQVIGKNNLRCQYCVALYAKADMEENEIAQDYAQ